MSAFLYISSVAMLCVGISVNKVFQDRDAIAIKGGIVCKKITLELRSQSLRGRFLCRVIKETQNKTKAMEKIKYCPRVSLHLFQVCQNNACKTAATRMPSIIVIIIIIIIRQS